MIWKGLTFSLVLQIVDNGKSTAELGEASFRQGKCIVHKAKTIVQVKGGGAVLLSSLGGDLGKSFRGVQNTI